MESETNTIKTAGFIIYPDLGQVEINNKTIRLGPVNMKVLLKLVHNSDKVVSRTELFDTVWNNQIIGDDTLTKCISEIRTKLRQHSNYQTLILNIPKKGYQWSPSKAEASVLESSALENLTPDTQLKTFFKSNFSVILLTIISVIVLTTSFLWVVNRLAQINHVPILLISIEPYDDNIKSYGNNLEDSLRKNILKTKNIRFLSKLVLLKNSQYSIFNRNKHFQALWAIEGRVRKPHAKLIFTLNLVDTRTALEVYSKSIEIEIEKSQIEIDKFSLDFIKTIEQRIKKR